MFSVPTQPLQKKSWGWEVFWNDTFSSFFRATVPGLAFSLIPNEAVGTSAYFMVARKVLRLFQQLVRDNNASVIIFMKKDFFTKLLYISVEHGRPSKSTKCNPGRQEQDRMEDLRGDACLDLYRVPVWLGVGWGPLFQCRPSLCQTHLIFFTIFCQMRSLL